MTKPTSTGPLLTFRHGVHPEEFKELSCNSRLERMPFVEEYILPLGQHTGAAVEALFTDLLTTLKTGSLCALGGGIPLPVFNAMDYFGEELAPYFER